MVGVAAVGQALSNHVNGRTGQYAAWLFKLWKFQGTVCCFRWLKGIMLGHVFLGSQRVVYINVCIYIYMYCTYLKRLHSHTLPTPAIPSIPFILFFQKKTPSVHLRSSTHWISIPRPWTKVPIMNPLGPEDGSFPCPLEMRSDKFRRSCSICLNPRWRRYDAREMDGSESVFHGKWGDISLIPSFSVVWCNCLFS